MIIFIPKEKSLNEVFHILNKNNIEYVNVKNIIQKKAKNQAATTVNPAVAGADVFPLAPKLITYPEAHPA